jgi:PAS domain S-box-containing protein
VESSQDAIFSATLDGLISSWNTGAERMYGYTAGEILNRPLSTLIPADRNFEVRDILDAIRRGESVTNFETVRITKRGAPTDASLTVSPVRDASGAIVGASGIQRDITEQKRAAAERERLLRDAQEARAVLAEQNERLLEVDRLKDEFIALVSHELRTPLTSIRGYLELVLEDELPREQREYLEVVERNSHRLLRLVSDLLLLAQIDARKLTLELQPLDLSRVAAESVEAARPAAEANGIELTFAKAALPLLHGDRARIAQVLDNLVSNAIKFTPAGGRVEVGSRIEGDAAVVAVEDSGIGIATEEQAQLFKRFYRAASATKREIQGTGLGLSISRAIAEEHGGEITVSSEQGVGTTFTLRLPLAETDVVGIGDRDGAAA